MYRGEVQPSPQNSTRLAILRIVQSATDSQRLLIVLGVLVAGVLFAQPAGANPIVDAMAEQFNDSEAARAFLNTTPDTAVLRYVQKRRQTGGEPERSYRKFAERYRRESFYESGCEAYRNNRRAFRQAQRRHDVDPGVILSIWGVETRFGAIKPSFEARRVLLALAQSDYRSDFFSDELKALTEEYLKGHLPRAAVRSSWAGALGQPQFIPSSYRRYARDGDGDGIRDIWTNEPDVIASIGYYLHEHGWAKNRPVIVADKSDDKKTVRTDSGTFTITSNYDVVQAYNPSRFYALAVGQLIETFQKRCIQAK